MHYHIYRIQTNVGQPIRFVSAWEQLDDARRWLHEGDHYYPKVEQGDDLFIMDVLSLKCWQIDDEGKLVET